MNLGDIAYHWSRQPEEGATYDDLKDELAVAWLRGDIEAVSPFKFSRQLFLQRLIDKNLVIVSKEASTPKTKTAYSLSGEVFIEWLPPIVVIANETWANEDWQSGFEQLADQWQRLKLCGDNEMELMKPPLYSLQVRLQKFKEWHAANGYHEQRFWADAVPAGKKLKIAKKSRSQKADGKIREVLDNIARLEPNEAKRVKMSIRAQTRLLEKKKLTAGYSSTRLQDILSGRVKPGAK